MSDAVAFTVSVNGVVCDATNLSVQYTPFGSTTPADDYYVSFLSGQDAGLEPNETVDEFVIVEYAGDVQVGTLSFSGVVTHQTTSLGHGLDEYGNVAVASDVEATGSCQSMLPCFAEGTRIATPEGSIAVECLSRGDRVMLATGATGKVAWMGHRRSTNGDVIHLRAGSFGQTPYQDLYLSSDHGVFVDGFIVPVGLLENEPHVVREVWPVVVFHHVELEEHGILLAEGLPVESYLDTGNRRQFANCPITYDPVPAASRRPCAPILLAGEGLEQIRKLVSRKAASQPIGSPLVRPAA